MSKLVDEFNEAMAARFRPLSDTDQTELTAALDDATAHHDCPEKRVKGRCHCVLND